MPEAVVRVVNVHNFGLSAENVDDACRCIRNCVAASHDAIGIVAGDFNVPLVVDRDGQGARPIIRDPASRRLHSALESAVDIVHPAATRFGSATIGFSRLDRFYVSGPRSRWIACQVEVQVPVPPGVMSQRGLSDHSLVHLHLCMQRMCGGSISLLWEPPARSQAFRGILAANASAAPLDDWNHAPVERWRYHKWILKESLATARRLLLARVACDDSAEATAQQLIAAARIVWSGDRKAASAASAVSPIFAGHVVVTSDRVAFRSPDSFERELAHARLAALEARDVEQQRQGATRKPPPEARPRLPALLSHGPRGLPDSFCEASALGTSRGRTPLPLTRHTCARPSRLIGRLCFVPRPSTTPKSKDLSAAGCRAGGMKPRLPDMPNLSARCLGVGGARRVRTGCPMTLGERTLAALPPPFFSCMTTSPMGDPCLRV